MRTGMRTPTIHTGGNTQTFYGMEIKVLKINIGHKLNDNSFDHHMLIISPTQ